MSLYQQGVTLKALLENPNLLNPPKLNQGEFLCIISWCILCLKIMCLEHLLVSQSCAIFLTSETCHLDLGPSLANLRVSLDQKQKFNRKYLSKLNGHGEYLTLEGPDLGFGL